MSRSGRESPQVEGWRTISIRQSVGGRVQGFQRTKSADLCAGGRRSPHGFVAAKQRAQQSAARRIDQASVPLPVQNGATTTSDAGNARFNPESGILSFTQPGFDPTKQQFAPGSGAISNAAGKTLLLAPSGIAGAAQPIGAVDAYGNSTARTDQMKAELAQLQANGGQGEGPRVSMLQSLPAEQADRDRFAQFVRQADADRLAHDLATGGGNARSNAGRIAALNAMRGGIADELGRRAQVEAAGIQGRIRWPSSGSARLSQLANTRIAGQTQMAVEDLRQSGPEKALRATKIQGEIEDEKAARAARNGLLSAINSGDPGKISKAWRMGIAAGVVKPEQQEKATPYKFHTDAEGGLCGSMRPPGRPMCSTGQTGRTSRCGLQIPHTLMEPDLKGRTRKRMSSETGCQFLKGRNNVCQLG